MRTRCRSAQSAQVQILTTYVVQTLVDSQLAYRGWRDVIPPRWLKLACLGAQWGQLRLEEGAWGVLPEPFSQ